MNRSITYRPEIDGLRAIAVVSVILFHADVAGFSGGFVGVDMFFVISGYLITSILIKTEFNTNSLKTFYIRRFFRLLPVLYFVMAAVIVFGWALLMPWDFENLGAEVVATTLFSNNIFHFLTSGNYWGVETHFKTLIHTWSLGVEEQFYFLISAILFIISAGKGKYFNFKIVSLLMFTILFLISVTSSVTIYEMSQLSVFYLAPFRLWELLAGSLLVFYTRRVAVEGILKESLCVASILVICLSVFFLEREALNPLLYIPTVAATALLILLGDSESLVGRCLRQSWLVTIGLLSYSLYLWHQPLFAFFRTMSIERPEGLDFALPLLFTIMLSFFTYKFIEQPFRRKEFYMVRVNQLGLLCATVALVCVGLIIYSTNGSTGMMASRLNYVDTHNANVEFNNRVVQLGADNARSQKDVLFLGDSFARDAANVAIKSGIVDRDGFLYYSITDFCRLSNFQVRDSLIYATAKVVSKIFVSPASAYWECPNFKNMIDALPEAEVYFVGTKGFGWSTAANLRLLNRQGAMAEVPLDRTVLEMYEREKKHFKGNTRYVDIIGMIRTTGINVRIADDSGYLLSFDTRHLSEAGASFLANDFRLAVNSDD